MGFWEWGLFHGVTLWVYIEDMDIWFQAEVENFKFEIDFGVKVELI